MISELLATTKKKYATECNKKLHEASENTEYFSNIPLIKNNINEAITENNKEQKNLKERKKNIIILNVPKPSTITHEKLEISDENLIKELCNYADESILEDENEITKIQRFGRKENANQPIRISVNTEKAKKKLFREL